MSCRDECKLLLRPIPKILPAGLTVEVISTKSFLSFDSFCINKFDKEHITNRYYTSENSFNIKNIKLPNTIDWQFIRDVSYTFDTFDDIRFLEYNINNLSNNILGTKYHLKLQDLLIRWDNINKK